MVLHYVRRAGGCLLIHPVPTYLLQIDCDSRACGHVEQETDSQRFFAAKFYQPLTSLVEVAKAQERDLKGTLRDVQRDIQSLEQDMAKLVKPSTHALFWLIISNFVDRKQIFVLLGSAETKLVREFWPNSSLECVNRSKGCSKSKDK